MSKDKGYKELVGEIVEGLNKERKASDYEPLQYGYIISKLRESKFTQTQVHAMLQLIKRNENEVKEPFRYYFWGLIRNRPFNPNVD